MLFGGKGSVNRHDLREILLKQSLVSVADLLAIIFR
jgi:hypothetical protein